MENIVVAIGAGVIAVLIVAIVYGALAWIFMLAWNVVMPAVFHLPMLTYWMAVGLVLLLGFVKQMVTVNLQK